MKSKFLPLLLITAALLWAPPARAEEAPPPPGPAASQQPPPAPAPAPTAGAPAPVAKKEDEEEGAGMMARLRTAAAALTNTNGVSGKIASLEKENAALQSTITGHEKAIAQLQADLQERTALLSAFDAWLQANGHTTAKEAAADPAAAFENAVGTGVANTVRKIGVPVATIKAKAPDAAPVTLEDVQTQLANCKTPAERQALLAKNRALILASN